MGYEELAAAIIYQAVKDYRSALKKQESTKEDVRAVGRGQEEAVMAFFRSQWCEFLAGGVDMEAFIEHLKKGKKPRTLLQKWRLSKGFTQKQAADYIGVHANSYSAWEKAEDGFYQKRCKNKVMKSFMTKLCSGGKL